MSPVNFIVEPDIIENTKCDKEFECLYGAPSLMCSVKDQIADILFMEKKPAGQSCRHKLTFGSSHTCTCLVRKAIRKNHGI